LSTAVDIDFDIDLSLLVGPLEDQGCEHSEHGNHRAHGEGPATHYIRTIHPCKSTRVYAACKLFVWYVKADLIKIRCVECRTLGLASEFLEVVGEIGSL